MQKQWFVLLVAVLASGFLWGCGSGGGSGGSGQVVTIADVDAAGIGNCVQCHTSSSPLVTDWVNTWLTSAHGNPNGRPRHLDPHDETSSCQPCHNQLLEGAILDEVFTATLIGATSGGTNVFANDPRDIVTCESCHGGGSAHRGVGPIPNPRPDWEQCVACHDHAEGVRHADDHGLLASNVGASAHNNSAEGTDGLHASTTRCQRCHTVEGSVQLAQYTGDADVMHLMDSLDPIDLEENLHPVTCAACHAPHDDRVRYEIGPIVNDNALAVGNWDPNGNATSDQFDFCTSCHNYYNQDGILIGSGSVASGTAPFYHNTAWYRTLTTTHYDDPTTTGIIEGYNVRQLGASPCFDCHGHELRTNTRNADADPDPLDPDQGSTIHSQWASSGHGGRLLTQVRTAADAIDCTDIDGLGNPSASLSRGRCEEIVDAAMMAGVDSTSGDAWVHYNWDEDGRQPCQDCHTATGAMNYLDDPATYDATLNDFSHLDSWVGATGSGQNETLYCWGCHENSATGVLRNPGAITRPYTVGAVAVSLPDVGSSNVCINCHGARGNMEGYFPDVVEDPSTDFTGLNAGFGPGTKNVTEAHYLVAAATVYAADSRIGYEYSQPAGALLDYTPVPYFAHDAVGLNADSPETGAGPCVACHMETEETHLFEVVTKDETTGVITALNATSCITCHDGSHGAALQAGSAAAAAFLEEEAEGYHEALEILRVGLLALGIEFQTGYPYFDTSVAGSWINEGNFGAAHNYNYLHHEPGAYAHNRIYAKRLLFDSIDWVDNYTLDGTITIDAVTYPEAALWFGADGAGVATRP